MTNQEIAKILYEIADFLEMESVPFKPYAYQKAALALETLGEDVREIYKRGGEEAIKKIPGVGESIAQKIIEYLKTGKIKYYQDYKKKYPVNMKELTQVEGLGPKMVRDLYKYLGIKNLKDLEKMARAGKIRNLPNFGEKTEQNILQGIEFLKRSKGRFLLGDILSRVREIENNLRSLKEVEEISVCGSVRRMKETIGDVDFLVVTKSPARVMDFFCSLPGVEKIWGKGSTKSSIRLKEGFDVDLRVVPKKSYGSALQYFTGSKEHNIQLRKIAIDKGLKLNEYGLFRGSKQIAGKTEKEIYKILGMECPPPELRENRGEIEAALKGKLPKLVELKDIKGDLHCHSKWDGGQNTIEEMAETAMARGYQYIGISDHTKFLKIEHGLDERKLAQQKREIEKLNSQFAIRNSQFKILQGCEANILKDGSIDISDEALKKLDYAIAGIHSHFKMPKTEMTERIIKAMKNPYIKIISHPTGRILKRRDEYQIDIDKILRAARETKTILEINSYPERLDLNDINIKRAIEMRIKLVINTDSHRKDQMRYMEYGVAQARRGWAEKKDIINTYPLEKLLKFFK
ncbi:MAG: DNA polymerase/3'-5' exonuclease PolX [Candidatus Nealsonbacteria bacterium]|nr:MAG: DNA polymerase/3'-5' exonuclease PolX [Candidatus Nealsonbacteria bacterium]